MPLSVRRWKRGENHWGTGPVWKYKTSHVSRLHFSMGSTGSRQTAPGNLWSEPSSYWSPSVPEQLKNVQSTKSMRKLVSLVTMTETVRPSEFEFWWKITFTWPSSLNTYSVSCSKLKKLWGVDQLDGGSMVTFRFSSTTWHLTIRGLSGRTGQKEKEWMAVN